MEAHAILNKLKREWREEENIELVQKRRRRYLHFDEVLNRVSPSVFNKVTSPEFVEKHSFFPLIRRAQKNRLYKRDPVTKTKIIKEKIRPISYASHFDSLIYSWYSHLISYLYEMRVAVLGVSDVVIAYRRLGKSNIDFAKEVSEFIQGQDNCSVIAFDIEGFYDNLDPTILKSVWASLLKKDELPLDHYKVFRSLTKHSFVDWEVICKVLNVKEKETEKIRFFLNFNLLEELRVKKAINIQSKGIPQGTPISCVLSNLYMLPFDIAVKEAVTEVGGLYRRYSDDIIIVCPDEFQEEIESLILSQIKKAKLKIEPSKTERWHFKHEDSGRLACYDDGGNPSKMQYLGVHYDGSTYLLRHKGRAKFERKMVKAVRKWVRGSVEAKTPIRRKKLYSRFSPLGEMNYITYARRAASGLGSDIIIKSLSVHRQHKKIKQQIQKEKVKVAKRGAKK